ETSLKSMEGSSQLSALSCQPSAFNPTLALLFLAERGICFCPATEANFADRESFYYKAAREASRSRVNQNAGGLSFATPNARSSAIPAAPTVPSSELRP